MMRSSSVFNEEVLSSAENGDGDSLPNAPLVADFAINMRKCNNR